MANKKTDRFFEASRQRIKILKNVQKCFNDSIAKIDVEDDQMRLLYKDLTDLRKKVDVMLDIELDF